MCRSGLLKSEVLHADIPRARGNRGVCIEGISVTKLPQSCDLQDWRCQNSSISGMLRQGQAVLPLGVEVLQHNPATLWSFGANQHLSYEGAQWLLRARPGCPDLARANAVYSTYSHINRCIFEPKSRRSVRSPQENRVNSRHAGTSCIC